MALDYHTIPSETFLDVWCQDSFDLNTAKSVAVERVFSQALYNLYFIPTFRKLSGYG